jgi:hypothetical protein
MMANPPHRQGINSLLRGGATIRIVVISTAVHPVLKRRINRAMPG